VQPASSLTLFGWPADARRAREGIGQTHHIAFRAETDDQLAAWREHVASLGHEVTEIRDRHYFKSIYFRAPDGLLVEIATDPPGFAIDEPAETMGSELRLPPWLKATAEELEGKLRPIR
jgi:glyoxalase family protein